MDLRKIKKLSIFLNRHIRGHFPAIEVLQNVLHATELWQHMCGAAVARATFIR